MDIMSLLSKFLGMRRKIIMLKSVYKETTETVPSNKYDAIDYFIEKDPVLYGSIRFVSLCVSNAFKRFDEYDQNISLDAMWLSNCLIKYGDVIVLRDDMEEPLPISNMSIIDEKKNIGRYPNKIIMTPNYYVIDEMSTSPEIFTSDEVYHISLCRKGNKTKDIYGRMTWNIYGIPPTIPVMKISEWKNNLINTDILVRQSVIPREHHQLDLEFDLANVPGKTIEEKYNNAKSFVDQELMEYATQISLMDAGEPYVTTKDVEIKEIEHKSSYKTPNELVSQLDVIMASAFGIPKSVVGESKGSYASELAVASYFMLIANSITNLLVPFMREKYGDNIPFEEASVTLEVWKTELFRRASLGAKIGILTVNELRKIIGFPPIENGDVLINPEAIDKRIGGNDYTKKHVGDEPITPNRLITKNKLEKPKDE